MDVKYINPFIESFSTVMPEIGFNSVRIGSLNAKTAEITSSGVIVIVGVVGAVRGNVVYTFELEAAKQIAEVMMMGEPVEELDETAKSAISELTNMLTAHAATAFSNIDILIDISTPTMLEGNNVEIKMSSNNVICVELFADDIPIEINISFE
ncbi:MAG: chemotaxis protein CheX [Oscillospiraceae bacterium]|nr:chemotaxis protein CheX [Oscillospiraceae bacterium]